MQLADPVYGIKFNSENGWFNSAIRAAIEDNYQAAIRASMENNYEALDKIGERVVMSSVYDGERVVMSSVSDGHGGFRAAEYVKQHLLSNLIKHPKLITDAKAAIDSEFLKADSHQTRDAGSTTSTAIISKGGQAITLSRDHKPDETDERQRIDDEGGFVMWSGTWRGVLSVSRAKRNHVRKGICMLSRAHNGGSSSEGIGNTLSGGNTHYRETDSAYNNMPEVILDNQAQVNCTGNFNVLSNLSIGPENIVLVAANKGKMETFMSGSVLLGNFELHDVHYSPDLGDIIIVSGSMLDNDDYEYKFGQGKFTVKDLKNDTTVGEGRLVDGNYILDYLKIPRDRTRAREQTGLVTTVWNAVCSALHRLGLKY